MFQALAIAAALGSTAMSAYGSVKSGKQAKANAETRATIEGMNADLLRGNAESARLNADLIRGDARLNARFLKQQAREERDRASYERGVGQIEALRRRQEGEKILSRQALLTAASGGGFEGSALALARSTAVEVDLQRRIELAAGYERAKVIDAGANKLDFEASQVKSRGRIAYANALAEADNLETQASMTDLGAMSTLTSGKNAERAGWMNAGATILSGVSSIAGKMPVGGSSVPSKSYDPSWSDTKTIRYL